LVEDVVEDVGLKVSVGLKVGLKEDVGLKVSVGLKVALVLLADFRDLAFAS
jgi:hypothetical protein